MEKYCLNEFLFGYLKITSKKKLWEKFEYEDIYRVWTPQEQMAEKGQVPIDDNYDLCPPIKEDFISAQQVFKKNWKHIFKMFGLEIFNNIFHDSHAKIFTINEIHIIIALYESYINDPLWGKYLKYLLPVNENCTSIKNPSDGFLLAKIKRRYDYLHPSDDFPDPREQVKVYLLSHIEDKKGNEYNKDKSIEKKYKQLDNANYNEIQEIVFDEIEETSRKLKSLLEKHMDVSKSTIDITEQIIKATEINPYALGKWNIH